MKAVDIADELYRELSSPADLSIPAVSYWLRTNLGALNNHLNTCYVLGAEPTYEVQQTYTGSQGETVTEEIDDQAKAVLKKMYIIHYYDNKLRQGLIAASTDSVISVSDDGSSIKKINKNDVNKIYLKILEDETVELKKMIYSYQRRGAEPLQVAGDDTIAGYYDPDRPVHFDNLKNFKRS
ncbi:hypothetical protein CL634_01580 [bacterium]|nr:hypothetical protein [bacterium]|tara:strand:+ start:50 stop:592 length:543 start_codon:yes stop_codon:yes gene_type:complete